MRPRLDATDARNGDVESEKDRTAVSSSLQLIRHCIPRAGRLLTVRPSGAEPLALPGDPVDQACGVQQRCCLIEHLLDVESDFKTLLMKASTCAGIGCAPYSRGLIEPVTDFS